MRKKCEWLLMSGKLKEFYSAKMVVGLLLEGPSEVLSCQLEVTSHYDVYQRVRRISFETDTTT